MLLNMIEGLLPNPRSHLFHEEEYTKQSKGTNQNRTYALTDALGYGC